MIGGADDTIQRAHGETALKVAAVVCPHRGCYRLHKYVGIVHPQARKFNDLVIWQGCPLHTTAQLSEDSV